MRCFSIRALPLKLFGFNSNQHIEIVLKRVQIVRHSPLEISRSKVIVVETAVVLIIRNLGLFFYLVLSASILSLSFSPLLAVVVLILGMFFFHRGHIGVTLIQLEFLSLLTLYVILTSYYEVSLKSLTLYLLFCVMASEAALGLSFLVIARRHRAKELEKFSV